MVSQRVEFVADGSDEMLGPGPLLGVVVVGRSSGEGLAVAFEAECGGNSGLGGKLSNKVPQLAPRQS